MPILKEPLSLPFGQQWLAKRGCEGLLHPRLANRPTAFPNKLWLPVLSKLGDSVSAHTDGPSGIQRLSFGARCPARKHRPTSWRCDGAAEGKPWLAASPKAACPSG